MWSKCKRPVLQEEIGVLKVKTRKVLGGEAGSGPEGRPVPFPF